MANQCRCIVLWNTGALTLGDEPLPCGMEHCASDCGIVDVEFGIGFDNPVHR